MLRRTTHVAAAATLACVAGAVVACSDATSGRPVAAPDGRSSRSWAADEAAAALGADGAFHIAPHVPVAGAEIDATQAGALAAGYAHRFGGWLRGAWERDRGANVDEADVARLQPCGPATYARSPHVGGDVPAGSMPEILRRALAPQYLVELCAGGTPMVSVAVSALATNARVAGGRIVALDPRDFTSYGISTRLPRSMIRPEDAALMAAQATGQRVAGVPELVLPPFPGAPQLARWRITLAAPVRVRGQSSGVVRSTREVYAGFGRTWSETAVQAAEPGAAAAAVRIPPGASDPGGTAGAQTAASNSRVVVQLPTAVGYPTAVEPVEVVP